MSQNITSDKFVHFSADNIDLVCRGVSVNSFNATQMAGWQRGPCLSEPLDGIQVNNYMGKLNIPQSIQTLFPIDSFQIAGNELKPVRMTLPAVPQSCQEIISCACKCGCNTKKCSCKKGTVLMHVNAVTARSLVPIYYRYATLI